MMRECGKMSYSSKSEALKDIKIIRAQQAHFSKVCCKAPKGDKKLRPYECFKCGRWHLTSQPKRKYKNATRIPTEKEQPKTISA